MYTPPSSQAEPNRCVGCVWAATATNKAFLRPSAVRVRVRVLTHDVHRQGEMSDLSLVAGVGEQTRMAREFALLGAYDSACVYLDGVRARVGFHRVPRH